MTRRPAGEGSVGKLANGRFRVRVPSPDGGPPLGGVYATEAEAENVRAALVAQIAASATPESGSLTVGRWVSQWIDERERQGYRSVRGERSVIVNRILPSPIAAMPLRTLTRAAVHEWIREQRESTVKRKRRDGTIVDTGRQLDVESVKRVRAILRQALAAAAERELIASNPAAGIMIRNPDRSPRWTYLSREEIALLLNHDAIPARFRLIYQFAIYTGMRRGEMWALRWRDINEASAEAIVSKSHRGRTKTGRHRTVPLLPPALDALRRLRSLSRYMSPDDFVFATDAGHQRNRSDRAQWGRNGPCPGYRTVCNFGRRVSFHAFRHTCASALVMGYWGEPWRLEDVGRFLGHESRKVTERYAHLSPDYLRTRADALSRDIRNAATNDTGRESTEESGRMYLSIKRIGAEQFRDVSSQNVSRLSSAAAEALVAAIAAGFGVSRAAALFVEVLAAEGGTWAEASREIELDSPLWPRVAMRVAERILAGRDMKPEKAHTP